VCEYAEVPLMQCLSHCAKFFATLRSATTSSTTTLVWERNPRVSVYEGTCPKLLTVTALLINRSLGNQGCVAHKFLLSASNPNNLSFLPKLMTKLMAKSMTYFVAPFDPYYLSLIQHNFVLNQRQVIWVIGSIIF
jgi:hypothetical protein